MIDRNKITVLLVEDEPVTAKAGKATLEKLGYKIIHAQSGEEAVELYNGSGKIDLILMDIDLGDGIDGTDAAIAILRDNDIPIVFLSSHMENDIVEKTEKITSYGYVVKNSGTAILDASIRMALRLFDSKQKMKTAEETYRNMFLNAQIGLFRTDIKTGMVIDANDCLARFAGYKNRVELLEDSFNLADHYVNPEDRERMLASLDKNGQYSNMEVQFRRKDGTHMWVRYSGMVVADKGWIEGVSEDITERKIIESAVELKNKELGTAIEELEAANEELISTNEELEATNEELFAANEHLLSTTDELQKSREKILEKERQLRVVTANIPVFISYADADNLVYRFVNQTIADDFGMTVDQIIGRSVREVIGEEEYMNTLPFIERVRKGEHVEFETIAKIKGETGWFHINYIPEFDAEGKVSNIIALASNITERKTMEVSLKEAEELYRNIFLNAQTGLFRTDIKTGILLDANDCMARFFGFEDRAGMMAKPFNFAERYVYDGDRERMIWMLKEKGYFNGYEVQFLRNNGSIIWMRLSARIVENRGWIEVVSEDITDWKMADEKIKILLAEKELILKEVHHRIKNNMNTINSILTLHADTLKDPLAISALEDAGSRVHSMMVLYDKLYQAPDFNEISVKSYVLSLVDEIVANFPESRRVKVEKNIDDFILDVKRLQPLGIIINELFTNIMKHAMRGKDDVLIYISVLLSDDHAIVEIRDNGTGIPESVDFETNTGFGLQLVKMLTAQIRGSIKIERERGTNFIIRFKI